MAGTGTSGVALGLLSSVRPSDSGDIEAFCSRLDCCNAGSAPVVMVSEAIARGGLAGAEDGPSLSKVQICCTPAVSS